MWLEDNENNLLSGLTLNKTGYINWELYNYQNELIISSKDKKEDRKWELKEKNIIEDDDIRNYFSFTRDNTTSATIY
jgi:hypothetical protein